jgi:hypothetical protein
MTTYTPTCTATKPTRTCRWLSENPAEALSSGHGALLQMTVPRSIRGGWQMLTTCYIVLPILGGFQLLKEGDGRVVETHSIDTSFGPAAEDWVCDCPAFTFGRQGACKHCCGLFAALKRAGL